MKVLVLNSGSSSQKSSLYELGESLPQDPSVPLWEARIEWNGGSADLQVSNSQGAKLREEVRVGDRQTAIERVLDTLWSGRTRVLASASEIDVVGHRVVHGGHKLEDATVVTPEVKSIIASVAVFAPLHNRAELEGDRNHRAAGGWSAPGSCLRYRIPSHAAAAGGNLPWSLRVV